VGRIEKLIERLLSDPKDLTWDELVRVLGHYGYIEKRTGKTGGSRRKFVNSDMNIVSLHKPHPSNIVKRYVINNIIEHLTENGKIKKDE